LKLRFQAVCFSESVQLRRTLRRALQGAGSTVLFLDPDAAEVEAALAEADLVVLDPEARQRVDVGHLGAKTRGQLMVVGESIAHGEVLELLRAVRLNHVMADAATLDDEALVVTSGKVFNGDIFGVEKYLAWGARVHERPIKSYAEKRQALVDLAAFVAEAGPRRPVAARIEAVADELIMNALYDAPAVRHGVSRRAAALLDPELPALLSYACDGRTLGVSVRDRYGALSKETILDHVARARREHGSPAPDAEGGAGLGLFMVLSSVTRFIVNVDPGQLTEVIGLFDIRVSGREQVSCARSIHLFTTRAAV
jgi:hypothetical protein